MTHEVYSLHVRRNYHGLFFFSLLYVYVLLKFTFEDHAMCSLGLSATSQQYFSLRTNQPPASSSLLSEQTSTSHQPPANRTEQAACLSFTYRLHLNLFEVLSIQRLHFTNIVPYLEIACILYSLCLILLVVFGFGVGSLARFVENTRNI
jgi:hypothetical protein